MKQKTYIVKAQRPFYPEDAPILIYSKCGTIPATQLPNEGALNKVLGDRNKAYFECQVDGERLVILKERRWDRW